MRGLLSNEGAIMQFFQKTGELIFATILFLLFCIPIITAGSSITSLYYAVIKSVRRERGYVTSEFMRSLRRTLGKGTILTIGMLLWFGSLTVGLLRSKGHMVSIYVVLFLISIFASVYVFPVLSRFEMKLVEIIKLSFVMSIRYFYFTILIVAGTALLIWLQFFYLPMPCILILPGAWCYAVTFMMERVLLQYMPTRQATGKNGSGGEAHMVDEWYYDDGHHTSRTNTKSSE